MKTNLYFDSGGSKRECSKDEFDSSEMESG